MKALVGALVVASAAAQEHEPRIVARLAPAADLAAHRLVDLDGDGAVELITVTTGGDVAVHALDRERGTFVARGRGLRLAAPDESVLACADVAGGPELELVVASAAGIACHGLGADGCFAEDAKPLLSARHGLTVRPGAPAFAGLAVDLNRDGRADLLLPDPDRCRLYLRVDDGAPLASFERVQDLQIGTTRMRSTDAAELSDTLRNVVQLFEPTVEDLNGDGRPDLLLDDGGVHEFFLQDAGGRFAVEPIRVDLSMFRDTTPRPAVQMGGTLAAGDRAHLQSGDVDGDGRPDFVIAHRRKVWIFRSTPSGPQFTTPTVFRIQEDVSWLLLMHLDDDDREDLLVFKVQLPTTAELAIGLVASIDIAITALGYRSEGEGRLARSPGWRRELTLRLPPLLGLLGRAEELVDRFFAVISEFRWAVEGEFGGDEGGLAMASSDDRRLELWRRDADTVRKGRELEVLVRRLLFEDEDPVFDVDRIFDVLAATFEQRSSRLSGGRGADAQVELRDPAEFIVTDLRAADLDGDGRQEIVVGYASARRPGESAFDVVGW